MKEALALAKVKPLVIDYDDPEYSGAGERLGAIEYEDFIARGRSRLRLADAGRRMGRDHAQLHVAAPPATRRASSITTAARICSRVGNVVTCAMAQASGLSVDAADVPLQRLVLPVVDLGRSPARMSACARCAPRRCTTRSPTHKVTHLCGAPIVMATLLNAPDGEKKPLPHVVEFFTAAAPPPEAVLAAMKEAGFNVTHLYGLTEMLRPGGGQRLARRMGRARRPPSRRRRRRARACATARSRRSTCSIRRRCSRSPRDGETLGEVMMRGNVVMKGYLKNKAVDRRGLRRRLVSHRRSRRHARRTATSSSRTAPRTSSSPAARTSPRSRSRTRSTSIRRCMAVGRGRQARRQMGRDALRLRRTEARHERDARTN